MIALHIFPFVFRDLLLCHILANDRLGVAKKKVDSTSNTHKHTYTLRTIGRLWNLNSRAFRWVKWNTCKVCVVFRYLPEIYLKHSHRSSIVFRCIPTIHDHWVCSFPISVWVYQSSECIRCWVVRNFVCLVHRSIDRSIALQPKISRLSWSGYN